ncbi:UDP-N-acetylmuramate--L-alanine ligase [Desulfurobacterium atlanticum]|uniref:UDP-N-acetylmuramate--L-alanine ligase n=1 Tax=Desulfurobacterium atlanticum TaxID=240169 RepID=A0A238ZY23_9BACT|nr:UDP-N-acetylmuramate--L-alanine ligase [Desulfurobacterium atlanticum]SNR88032.1 UDP-N-acetylmuramate--L-alanine ligase [Desulfurobacterium atlanticum]
MFKFKTKNLHFIGIGGIGISGLAYLFKKEGYNVTGSDIKESDTTEFLKKENIKIYIGHRKENVENSDVVIHTTAAKETNPEIVAAKEKGIPVIPRCDALSELMRFKEGISVAGTHGKTTTSSMIAKVLFDAELDPTILVGGKLDFLEGKNAHYGKSSLMVAETDESDGTFLKILPSISVITNIDSDHLDFYKTLENIKSSFVEFANRTSFYGKVFLCGECKNVMEILPKIYKKKVIYGFNPEFEFSAKNIKSVNGKTKAEILYKGKTLGTLTLTIPGKHNILNALAAVALGLEAGIPFEKITCSLENFKNAKRRMELKGCCNNILIFDDYGHHPTEIEATYQGLKETFPERKIYVVFQPHRYTRTKALWKEFIKTLKKIDNLTITAIYSAGEEPIEGICGEMLAKLSGAEYGKNFEEIESRLLKKLKPGDIVLTMGAGNIYKLGEKILSKLQTAESKTL